MTIAKEAVYALHQRLKDLSIDAPADQLAYLAKALESIAGHSTVYDIVNMSDEKLQELLEAANTHLADLNASKVNSLAAIDTSALNFCSFTSGSIKPFDLCSLILYSPFS